MSDEAKSTFSPAEQRAVATLCQKWGGCPLCGVRNISIGRSLFGLIACEVLGDGTLKLNADAAVPVMTVTCKGCLFSFFLPYRGIQELTAGASGLEIPGRPKLFKGV